MAMCEVANCNEHYGCRLRSKGLQVSPKATPTKTLNWRPTKSEPPAINRQIIYEDRPGGSKIPILKLDGEPLRGKEYRENKSTIDATIHSLRNSGTSTKD